MRLRRVLLVVLVLMLAFATACSDPAVEVAVEPADAPEPAAAPEPTATPEPAAAPEPTATPEPAPEPTATPEPAPEPTATPEPVPEPTALDSLGPFFAAAEDLDARIRAVAAEYNAVLGPEADVVPPALLDLIAGLDAIPVGALIPPGLSPELERAVLAVFADLDSRVASLNGGAQWAIDLPDDSLRCLDNGARSAARYADDVAAARALAAAEVPPTAAADSVEAGTLAVRLDWIHKVDWGCEACGGFGLDLTVPIDDSMPVDWAGGTIADGGVEFEATFDGAAWEVRIYAC